MSSTPLVGPKRSPRGNDTTAEQIRRKISDGVVDFYLLVARRIFTRQAFAEAIPFEAPVTSFDREVRFI